MHNAYDRIVRTTSFNGVGAISTGWWRVQFAMMMRMLVHVFPFFNAIPIALTAFISGRHTKILILKGGGSGGGTGTGKETYATVPLP